jgi:hypothetical protein
MTTTGHGRNRPRILTRLAMLLALAVLSFAVPQNAAEARSKVRAFAETLAPADREAFEKWYFAHIAHDAAMDSYWNLVERKRSIRRRVRREGWNFKPHHYVRTFPPVYDGPTLTPRLLSDWRAFRDRDKPGTTPGQAGLPGLDVYLADARSLYGFVPERIPEAEFKRRYAAEALRVGLTKDQIIRIYALETGGYGTADMQAGIHPITGRGRPISSALGYAQLLSANTINMVAKYGNGFVERLEAMAARTTNSERRAQLNAKIRSLRKMIRTAKSVPYQWSRHVALSRTARGRGLHPLNIDGDIGPWLQVIKLAELKKMAAGRGVTRLSGAEIELMNLAGPATGLEMMMPVAHDKPTTNFFSRQGYNRNTIVRNGRTAKGLLHALEERMNVNMKNAGALEFAAIFDRLLSDRRQARND